jgi:hypothetical protein
MSGSWNAGEFPNLKASDFTETSIASEDYNCIAWAAGDTSKRWDPDAMYQYYWPANVPRNDALLSFVAAFHTVGFELCQDFSVENGFEKIAIYAFQGKGTHVALQLKNGSWTSKLGDYEDIEHKSLECLEDDGEMYGWVARYMRRRRP